MYHSQLPEAETNGNGNGKGPTWKWIVGILISVCGALLLLGVNSIQGQLKNMEDTQKTAIATVHNRISRMDETKADKELLNVCLKSLEEKIDHISKSIDKIERRTK